MAKTNWQDPKTSEMRSTHVSGLMEAVGKIEDSIGMESVFETNVPLTEVFISSDDRYRIFQAPEGKRNWTAEQAPVIKRNGSIITSGFEIDYGGGAIILNVNDTVENTYTADVKYTKTTEIDVSADINAHNTSGTAHDDIRESINTLDADLVTHKAEKATQTEYGHIRLQDIPIPTKDSVGLGNVDNLKQMPISGGVLENYREKLVTLSGTSVAINLSLGNVFTHTLSGNTTYSITNAVSGQAHSFTLMITQTATVRTLTFPASVKWQGGEIPDMSTANKTYVLTFVSVDGGSNWLGMFGGEF